jgi:hypothetical protein
MNDTNKRLCELLGCDVPRPKDICPTCGKTNTAKRSVPVMTRILEFRGKEQTLKEAEG